MMTDAIPLERVTRVGPLGVRFWDAVEQSFIADGLVVRVRPKTAPAPRIALTANTSAIFAALNLPGLRDAEFGAGYDAFWAAITKHTFVVEVADPRGRYLPMAFDADLPARGLFTWSCAMAPVTGLTDGVPLYSAPSRMLASMRGVLRADLRDATSGLPAAGAVITATIDGTYNVTGIADPNGRIAIQFPFPEPRAFPSTVDGVPPAAPSGASLAGYTWPVVLAARYTPLAPGAVYPDYPDLCTTFDQPAASLWSDTTGALLGPLTLHMGTELIVRTTDAGTSKPLSELWIKSA